MLRSLVTLGQVLTNTNEHLLDVFRRRLDWPQNFLRPFLLRDLVKT